LLSAPQRDDATVDLRLFEEVPGAVNGLLGRSKEGRRVIDADLQLLPALPFLHAQSEFSEVTEEIALQVFRVPIHGLVGQPVQDLLIQLGALLGKAVPPQMQHGQRGQHQRIAGQDVNGGNGHRGAEFGVVALGGGFVAALEPAAPLQQKAVDSFVVQVVDGRLFETHQGGPALMGARARGDHHSTHVLARRQPEHLHDLLAPWLIGGFVQPVQQKDGVFRLQLLQKERLVEVPSLRGQEVRDPTSFRRMSGVSRLAAVQRLLDVLVKLADADPQRESLHGKRRRGPVAPAEIPCDPAYERGLAAARLAFNHQPPV
jgi:hypothetical protein